MTEYKVVIEETAENDLLGILNYIKNTLREPNIAMKIYGSIKKVILSLKQMPFRYALLNEEPYRSMGVRQIPIENYIAFSDILLYNVVAYFIVARKGKR